MENGKYIVIEGQDATGKGEQTKRLHSALGSIGVTSEIITEPGHTSAGVEIRKIVKNAEHLLDGITNILLFTANRRDIWYKSIKPNLDTGIWTIEDRNWYSTYAYQGAGQGAIELNDLKHITETFVSKEYVTPDLVIVLKLEEDERNQRLKLRGDTQDQPDAFESQDNDFQERVNMGYIDVAQEMGAVIVSASGSPDEVHNRIWDVLKSRFDLT